MLELEVPLITILEKKEISWEFIPPYAPHVSGLWEAGVKSMKHHLYSTVGNALPTYDELSTALYQISACLNPRHLTSMSEDPDDLEVITPSHFLIGSSMLLLPEPSLLPESLKRWERAQWFSQNWWKKWRSEYLSRLQNIPRWLAETRSLRIGQLVLISDDSQGLADWVMGRITNGFPGSDGKVRVDELRKKRKELVRRSIAKTCPLPDEEDENVKKRAVNIIMKPRQTTSSNWDLLIPERNWPHDGQPKQRNIRPAGEDEPELIKWARPRRRVRPRKNTYGWMLVAIALMFCAALGQHAEDKAVIAHQGRIVVQGYDDCEFRLGNEVE